MESIAQTIGTALVQADKSATLWINSINCPASDAVWIFFSNRFAWIPLYSFVIFLLFRKLGWKKTVISIVALALTILICDQFANLIKNSVCRFRPSHDEWMLANGLHLPHGTGGRFGYFSAHAANSFAFAIGSHEILSSSKTHRRGLYVSLMMLWATLVSLSRIFLGRHFLGDILTGAAVGLLFGYLIALTARRFF